MTFEQAMANQPLWVQVWTNILFAGAFVLPLSLLIWKASRLAGAITVAASVLAGIGITWLFGQLGYVRLLGLPHVVIWTPLVIYLWRARPNFPMWPARITMVICTVIAISLVFDIADTARYILGDRAPF